MDAQLQRPLSKLRALSRLRDGHQRYSAMDRSGILPERLSDDETPYCASTMCPSGSLQPAECSDSNSMLIRSQLRMDDVDDDNGDGQAPEDTLRRKIAIG